MKKNLVLLMPLSALAKVKGMFLVVVNVRTWMLDLKISMTDLSPLLGVNMNWTSLSSSQVLGSLSHDTNL